MRTAKRGAALFEHTYDRINVCSASVSPSHQVLNSSVYSPPPFHKWNITPMECFVKGICAFEGEE